VSIPDGDIGTTGVVLPSGRGHALATVPRNNQLQHIVKPFGADPVVAGIEPSAIMTTVDLDTFAQSPPLTLGAQLVYNAAAYGPAGTVLYGFANSVLTSINTVTGQIVFIGSDKIPTIAGMAFVTLDADCNDNAILDECEISADSSIDQNGNGFPDECED
jgi:hypothetical protein